MADTAKLSAQELLELAGEIQDQVDTMRLRSQRATRVYIGLGIFLIVYMAWAFNRIANFIDPTSLADNTAEIAIDRAKQLITEGERIGRSKAPDFVRIAEVDVIHSIPEFRMALEKQVRTRVGQLVKSALAESDRVIVEELAEVPDGTKLMVAAEKDPDAAARLYGEIRKAVLNRADMRATMAETMVELNKLRDRMRKMKDNHNLTPSERAERHLLQLVLEKLELPAQPITAAAVTASAEPKHKKVK